MELPTKCVLVSLFFALGVTFCLAQTASSSVSVCNVKKRFQHYQRPKKDDKANLSDLALMLGFLSDSLMECSLSCTNKPQCRAYGYRNAEQFCYLFQNSKDNDAVGDADYNDCDIYRLNGERNDISTVESGYCPADRMCQRDDFCADQCPWKLAFDCLCQAGTYGKRCEHVFQHVPVQVDSIPTAQADDVLPISYKNKHWLLALTGYECKTFDSEKGSQSLVDVSSQKFYLFNTTTGKYEYDQILTFPAYRAGAGAFIADGTLTLYVSIYIDKTNRYRSYLYNYNDKKDIFEQVMNIKYPGLWNVCEYRRREGKVWMGVTQQKNDINYGVALAYRWNPVAGTFDSAVFTGNIYPNYYCDFTEIGTDLFFLATTPTNGSHSIKSVLFRLNGAWTPHQSLPGTDGGGMGAKFFHRDGTPYLVMSNYFTPTNVVLLQWNNDDDQFRLHQVIPSDNSSTCKNKGLDVFQVTEDWFMGVACEGGAEAEQKFYRFVGDRFVLHTSLQYGGIVHIRHFWRDHQLYVVLVRNRDPAGTSCASMYDVSSPIYKWT